MTNPLENQNENFPIQPAYAELAGNNTIHSVCQWNCEGASSILKLPPTSEFEQFEILILTETFTMKSFEIPGFYAFHALATKESDGPGRPQGGVSIFVSPKCGQSKNIYTNKNTIVVQTELLSVIAVYASPDEDKESMIINIEH